MSEVSDKIRAMFKQGDDVRDAGLTTPDDVERFDGLSYGPDPRWQVLDVYRPKGRQGELLPVIVSVHGGGWVYGDKERYQYYCMSLTRHGFGVVNFTYRLAPEFKYPAAIEDTNMVMAWLGAHGAEYGLDTSRVFAVGDSAGAQNLALYAAIWTNPAYAARYDFTLPAGVTLRAIGLNCGVYAVDPDAPGEELTRALMADYLPQGGSREEIDRISVVNHLDEHYLPACLMTCTGDFLQKQAALLEAKLMEKQIEHTFLFYGGPGTSLGHVFHLNMKEPLAHRFNAEQCAFFKRYLD